MAGVHLAERRKGVGIAIEAIKKTRHRPLTLLTLGSDPPAIDLPDVWVHHLGFIDHERTKALVFNAADLFIHPALADNLPNTVIESIACGTPVIAFDVGGLPELVIPGKTGWLVPGSDAESFAQAIDIALEEIASGAELRNTCRQLAMDGFSFRASRAKIFRINPANWMIELSVITPVYNGGKYIENCLLNVVQQECPRVEHIIIDGGSTDGSVDLVRNISSGYPHIRWISEKDRGQSDALNKGIAIARGRILGILNVDDTYEPGVLNRVLGLFEDLPEPAMLVGNCNVWDDNRTLIEINKPKRMRLQELLLGPALYPYPFNPSAYFYHGSLHDQIGKYDVSDALTMDLDFLLRAVQKAFVQYYDETWGNFYLRSGSKTVMDMNDGLLWQRRDKKLESYRHQLPWLLRQKVSFLYWFYNSRSVRSARYFWMRPEELPWRVRDRVIKVIENAVHLGS